MAIIAAEIAPESMFAWLNAEEVPPGKGVVEVLLGEGALLAPEALAPGVPLPEPPPLETLLLGLLLLEPVLAELLLPVVVPLELLVLELFPPKDGTAG